MNGKIVYFITYDEATPIFARDLRCAKALAGIHRNKPIEALFLAGGVTELQLTLDSATSDPSIKLNFDTPFPVVISYCEKNDIQPIKVVRSEIYSCFDLLIDLLNYSKKSFQGNALCLLCENNDIKELTYHLKKNGFEVHEK